MQEFPANSNKAKAAAEPRERIAQVTSAETVRRKRGLGQKFKETFIGGDARSATEIVFFEVIIPSVRDTLYDAFDAGMRSLIFGDHKKHRTSGSTSGYSALGHVAYNRMSQPSTTRTETRSISRRARARHDFDDVIIPTRQEAEETLDRMFEWLSRYGRVSVAELYELTGVQSSHTDEKWGWTELQGSKPIRLRTGGWLLDLPDPEPLS